MTSADTLRLLLARDTPATTEQTVALITEIRTHALRLPAVATLRQQADQRIDELLDHHTALTLRP